MTSIPTKEKLAQVLHGNGLLDIEKRARAGAFDDFESESCTPIVDLVSELRRLGHPELAAHAVDGEWDCTLEESEAWIKGTEGQNILKKLVKND